MWDTAAACLINRQVQGTVDTFRAFTTAPLR
jgi:hypothetical protein